MKIINNITAILIILVLFTFNVKAEDNLFSQSIVCKTIKDASGDLLGKKIRIEGYEFLQNSKLNHFYYYSEDNKIMSANDFFKRDYFYETDLSTITMYFKIGTRQVIDRETLEIRFYSKTLNVVQFKPGECKAIKSKNLKIEMDNAIKETVKELKKNNKI